MENWGYGRLSNFRTGFRIRHYFLILNIVFLSLKKVINNYLLMYHEKIKNL